MTQDPRITHDAVVLKSVGSKSKKHVQAALFLQGNSKEVLKSKPGQFVDILSSMFKTRATTGTLK